MSTAPDADGVSQTVRVTHPFHPLRGLEFRFAYSKHCWGLDRVFCEGEWNACLRELEDAQRECERKHAEDRRQLDEGQRQRILALATDFPCLWNDPATPDRERKRMARLLIEDVTMTKGEDIALGVRLRGGATEPLALLLAPRASKTTPMQRSPGSSTIAAAAR